MAVVEDFFDIIYSMHVESSSEPGKAPKHAGQKKTYRAVRGPPGPGQGCGRDSPSGTGMTGQVGAEPLAGGRGEVEPSVPVRGGVRKEGFKGRAAAVLGDRNPGCSGSTARLLGEERAGESYKDTVHV